MGGRARASKSARWLSSETTHHRLSGNNREGLSAVLYGRDVGYAVERIVLDEPTEAISATQVRRLSTAP
jgi:hypothetical protein